MYIFFVLLVIFAASCLGFIRINVKLPSTKQFIVTDSQSRVDLKNAAQFFPLLDSRQEQVIVTAKRNRNVLNEECLKEAILVHKVILIISDYRSLCVRRPPSKGDTRASDAQDCIVSSPLELAGPNFEHLRNFSSILAREWNNPRTILSDGQSLRTSHTQILGNFKVNNETDPPTSQAEALRITYFIKNPTSEDEKQKVKNFETTFESQISSLRDGMKCASFSYKSGKATDDALQQILKIDILALSLSTLVVLFLSHVVIYFVFSNLSCLTTALFVFSTVLLPYICTAGIVSMAGISLLPTTIFIPFLLLGKLTSDVALFLGEWRRQNIVPSLEHRVTSCIARVGTVQLFSAFCATILLGIIIKSSFEVIFNFFLVTVAGFALALVVSFIMVPTLTRLLERESKPLNSSCMNPNTEFSRLLQEQREGVNNAIGNFIKKLPCLITSLGGKILSLLVLICFTSFCVFSALHSSERVSATENLYRENANFNEFTEAQQTFFGKQTDVSVVFSHEIDYSQKSKQEKLLPNLWNSWKGFLQSRKTGVLDGCLVKQ